MSEIRVLLEEARCYVEERARQDHARSSWGPARDLLDRIDAALGRDHLPRQPADWPEPKLVPKTTHEANARNAGMTN